MASFSSDTTITDESIDAGTHLRLTSGEAVTISGNATLTVKTGKWTENGGVGALNMQGGTLRIVNESTTVGYRFLHQSTASPIVSGGARIRYEFEGRWISIGTGTGAAGQTVNHWDTTGDFCPCIWVEDGAGSGNYEKYLNLSPQAGATHTVNSLSRVGPGKYGKFFTQSGNVLTFGDGTNGKAPPAGANIRVPNLIISGSFPLHATLGTSYRALSTQDAVLVADTVQFSRVKFSGANGSKTVRVYRCGILGNATWGKSYDAIFEDCGFAHPQTEVQILFQTNGAATPLRNWVLRKCSGWAGGTSATYPVIKVESSQAVFEDCEFFQITNIAAPTDQYRVLHSDINSDITLIRGVWVGGLYVSGVFESTDTEFADNPRLVEENTASSRKLLNPFGTMSKFKVTRPYIPAGGGCYYYFIGIYSGSCINNFDVRGLRCDSTYFNALLGSDSTLPHRSIFFADWYAAAVRGALISSGSYFQFENGVFQNLRNGGTYRSGLSGLLGSGRNTTVRSCALTDAAPGGNATFYDNFFYSVAKDATGAGTFGTLTTTPTAATNVVTFGGGAFVDNNSIVLPAQGDYAIIECPYKVLGISEFKTTGMATSAFNGVTVEYDIDTGSGYSGTWKSVNVESADLANEVLDPEAGFKFKLRYINNTATLKACQTWYRDVTIDESVMYPTAFVSIILRNLVPGSRFIVTNTATGESYGSGEVPAGASTIELSGIPFFYDFGIAVKVRNASGATKYVPFQTQAQVTANGADVWIAQVEDSVAV